MQHKLRAQRGACAHIQRAIILHGGKLVALAAFGAAMQAPGALGWILTSGVIIFAPLLGGPAATRPGRQALLGCALGASDCIVAGWMLAQYAFEVRLLSRQTLLVC